MKFKLTQKYSILIIIGIIFTFTLTQVSGATSSLSTIITDTGILQIPNNGTIHLKGDNFIKTSNSGSTVNVSLSNFYFLTQVNPIHILANGTIIYLNDQMSSVNNDLQQITHYQPLNGTFFAVSLSPIINNLNQTITFTLYDNGVSTGKSITINNSVKTNNIYSINYDFNKGDNLYWIVTSTEIGTYELIDFNTQILIIYNR